VDVESLAVSKITSMISRCPHLKAFITTNDKTPLTDGHIDLYSEVPQSNASWAGRVPVQVKGRAFEGRTKSAPTYWISRTELLAYQKDSGVLFLVVAVHRKRDSCTPYFALLSPFRIAALLGNLDEEASGVTVALTKLNNAPKDIERLVALALKTRKQDVSLGFDPLLWENAESLTLHTAQELDFGAPVSLDSRVNDFALELKTKSGMVIPLDGEFRIVPAVYAPQRTNLKVACGAVSYEDVLVKRLDADTFEMVLSAGLRLVVKVTPEGEHLGAQLTLERGLPGRLKAMEFFAGLRDAQSVEIGGRSFSFRMPKGGDDEWFRSHLTAVRELTELLEHVGVDCRLIDLDEVDDRQARQLRVLYRAFVTGEEIYDTGLSVSRVIQRVGPWDLMFLITNGAGEGWWKFVDPFSVEVRRQFLWSAEDDQELIPATAYDLVEPGRVDRVINLRLHSIVGAYEAIADSPRTYELANQQVLALISAADLRDERRREFLDAADSLNAWLLSQQGELTQHLLNHWQIRWRRGALSIEDRSRIRQLKRQIVGGRIDGGAGYELACALLLGQHEEAEELFARLSDVERERFKGWPIWRLRDVPPPIESQAEIEKPTRPGVDAH
jgi:hypothetical protein